MPITIRNVFTATPSSPLVAQRSFQRDSPFAITAELICSPNLVARPFKFDILFQLLSPYGDPGGTGLAWFRQIGRNTLITPSVDILFRDQPIISQRFFQFMVPGGAGRYSDLMRTVGNGLLTGVFGVRALVYVQFSADDFDISEPWVSGSTFKLF